MTENMINELLQTMDGMYRLMGIQQAFLDRAAERMKEGNQEIEEYQGMLEEKNRQIEEYQELLEEKDQEIGVLQEKIGKYQRLNTRLNEENEFFKRQNQELLYLKNN